MATVKNLTPHTIRIVSPSGETIKSYPSEGIARATQHAQPVGELDGVELVQMEFGEITGLPAPEEETAFVVSAITANAAKATGRMTDDLVITADPVRDETGRIIGCLRFARV